MRRITYVSDGDWAGVYVGNLLVVQDHVNSLTADVVLSVLHREGLIGPVEELEVDADLVEQEGSLPVDLDEARSMVF